MKEGFDHVSRMRQSQVMGLVLVFVQADQHLIFDQLDTIIGSLALFVSILHGSIGSSDVRQVETFREPCVVCRTTTISFDHSPKLIMVLRHP